jgi:hypothetical protein
MANRKTYVEAGSATPHMHDGREYMLRCTCKAQYLHMLRLAHVSFIQYA